MVPRLIVRALLVAALVALLSDEGTCGDPSVVLPDPVPLLLDVSLRGVAFHGSQVVAAVAASANRF
jgi:hypothetical protein